MNFFLGITKDLNNNLQHARINTSSFHHTKTGYLKQCRMAKEKQSISWIICWCANCMEILVTYLIDL